MNFCSQNCSKSRSTKVPVDNQVIKVSLSVLAPGVWSSHSSIYRRPALLWIFQLYSGGERTLISCLFPTATNSTFHMRHVSTWTSCSSVRNLVDCNAPEETFENFQDLWGPTLKIKPEPKKTAHGHLFGRTYDSNLCKKLDLQLFTPFGR